MTHFIGKRNTRIKYRVYFATMGSYAGFWCVVLDRKDGKPLGRPFMIGHGLDKIWRKLADRERRIAENRKIVHLIPREPVLRYGRSN